jgi:perosamine synthetase
LRALASGARAAWFGGGTRARRSVTDALRAQYLPAELFLTDTGTSALRMALNLAQTITGRPAALPAYCCYDVATAMDGTGAAFLLYDVDPETLSPDRGSLRRALEAGARSVVLAHLFGVPADVEAVVALAAEFGALVIEDAAQASGCEFRGKPAGTLGALGVLSFGRGKGVTGGKGGALLVNDPRLVDLALAEWNFGGGLREPRGSIRDYALLKAQWLLGRPSLYWIPASLSFLRLGETIYRRPHPVGGISSLAAGVLARTLPLAPREVSRRRFNAERLQVMAGGGTHPAVPDGWVAGWLRFPIVLQRTAQDVLLPYHRRAGVVRGYPRSLADLEGFGSRRLNAAQEFPGARLLAERLVTMPTHRFVRGAKVSAF